MCTVYYLTDISFNVIFPNENVTFTFKNHDLFVWSDGWRTSYTNWGNEDNSQEEACAELDIINGRWNAMPCDNVMPYMCKFSTGIKI